MSTSLLSRFIPDHPSRSQPVLSGRRLRPSLISAMLVTAALMTSWSTANADCLPWQRDCNGTAMNGGTVDGYGHTWNQTLGGGYSDETGRIWSQDMNNNWVRSDGYSVQQNMGGGYTDSKGQNFNQTLGGTWQGDRGTSCTQQVSGYWACQ